MPKIHLVKYKYEADKKVYFVDYPYEADEKVFIVKYAYEADYKAFEVKYAYEADTKVYRVKYAYEADEFKRSSRTPKSTGFFSSSRSSGSSGNSSSSGSSSSDSSSTISDFSSGSSFGTSSTNSSDSSSGGGCFSKLFSWLVVIALIGGALKYFGIIGDESIGDSSGKIINTKGLNLRTEPGTSGEIIKLMIQNDSIWQLNDSSQEIGSQTWVYVTDKVDTGWVNKKYLK
jgi:hypothetical protein